MTPERRQFFLDTLERAVKTFAQALLAALTVDGISITDMNWLDSLGVAALAALVSVLTSVVSFPKTGTASLVVGRHAASEEDSSPEAL